MKSYLPGFEREQILEHRDPGRKLTKLEFDHVA